MKKILSVFLCICLTLSIFTVSASAKGVNNKRKQKQLVEAGYTQETVQALSQSDLDEVYSDISGGDVVGVESCAMEEDNLTAIEDFLSYSEEELVQEYGLDQTAVEQQTKEINDILQASDSDLQRDGLSSAEIKALRSAEKNSKNKDVNRRDKKSKSTVKASGTIRPATMTYTQTVAKTASYTSKNPSYNVTVTYAWAKPYTLAVFVDNIIIAWGGGLASKSYSSTAYFYTFSSYSWGRANFTQSMGKETSPNVSVKFKVPQCVGKSYRSYKTKQGTAKFVLYQTNAAGNSTSVVSKYCHKILTVSGSVSASTSGLGVSIKVGSGWDSTSQKETTGIRC